MAIEAKDVAQCNTNSARRVETRVRGISYVCILPLGLFATTLASNVLLESILIHRGTLKEETRRRNLDETCRTIVR